MKRHDNAIIALDEFRRRKAERTKDLSLSGPPIVWVPVWVWVPMWAIA